MKGLTSRIDAVPHNKNKDQASDIQTTQNLWFILSYKTYLQSIHSKHQCNLNVSKTLNLIVLKHSRNILKCVLAQ